MLHEVSRQVDFQSLVTALTCDHSPYSEHQLLQASNPASYRRVRDFGLVHWHNHDQETNAQTCDGTPSVEEVQMLASRLQGSTEAEDDGAYHDGKSTPEPVAHGSCQPCTEESTTSEQRHYSTTFLLVSSFDGVYD